MPSVDQAKSAPCLGSEKLRKNPRKIRYTGPQRSRAIAVWADGTSGERPQRSDAPAREEARQSAASLAKTPRKRVAEGDAHERAALHR